MYYVYVIRSLKDGKWYTGFTCNVEHRLREHNSGEDKATKSRVPFELVYIEGCTDNQDALAREKYLKSGVGKKFLKYRLRNYLVSVCSQGRAP